jgi:hypothetical protein
MPGLRDPDENFSTTRNALTLDTTSSKEVAVLLSNCKQAVNMVNVVNVEEHAMSYATLTQLILCLGVARARGWYERIVAGEVTALGSSGSHRKACR